MVDRMKPMIRLAIDNAKPLLTMSTMILAASVCYAIAWTHTQQAIHSQIEVYETETSWITSPGEPHYSGYFRKRFFLPSDVESAWLAVSALDAFEISINNDLAGASHLWRPTRPFQNGQSENGLRLTQETSAMALNFPREYQWTNHENWRVPTIIDCTSSFQEGENIIAIEVETRRAPASLWVEGEIILRTGERIKIQTDSTWKSRHVPGRVTQYTWHQLEYNDFEWGASVLHPAPRGKMYSNAPREVFTQPFQGEWLRHPSADANEPVWFEGEFQVEDPSSRAWLRVAANRYFDLEINETWITSSAVKAHIDAGCWILNGRRNWSERSAPELLDPDSVGSFVVGSQFENPSHGNPTIDDMEYSRSEYREIDTERSARLMMQDPDRHKQNLTSDARRRWDWNAPLFPESTVPVSLSRNQAVGGYLGYDITNALVPGTNRIRIRFPRPLEDGSLGWQPQVAVDGGLRTSVHGESPRSVMWSDSVIWRTGLGIADPTSGSVQPVVIGPVQRGRDVVFPELEYRGVVGPTDRASDAWTSNAMRVSQFVSLACLFLIFLCIAFVTAIDLPYQRRVKIVRALCFEIVTVLFSGTVVVATALLVESSMSERHEMIWFTQPFTWWLIFAASAALAVLTMIVSLLGWIKPRHLRSRGHAVEKIVRGIPKTSLWTVAIVVALFGCFALRVHQLEFQPLDDDEYASLQAILSIAETGAPGFVPDDVYYTRSPLFHYLMGGIAFVFGSNVWALKIPAALFGVATAWLTYEYGNRLLGNRWIGMAGLVLVAIHPFEIYTGHIIRFYQMQQFFALLCIYCFCRGFVCTQSQGYRYATILVFLAAVLSQEISAVLAFPLAIGYVLFGKDLGWSNNIKLILLTGACLAIIVADFLVFQTRCLTRVEGVSASLEATVKPHFWFPYNVFTLYIGYSRLHILLSAFMFAGLPFIWRERNKNAIALHLMLLLGVVLTNLLVTHVSLRYQYWLIPIWLLASLDGMRAVLMRMIALAHHPLRHRNRYMWSMATATVVIFTGIVVSWSPWRIPDSYNLKLLGDSTGAFSYVREHQQEGDSVAATEPHTHAGFIETGKVDLDISIPLLYDFAMLEDGMLIDRNGGAQVVGSVTELKAEMAKRDRIWILLNREKFRSRGKNLRWEYPTARAELFIRRNCELKHRTYLWSVYLWDVNAGHYESFSD